MHSPTILPSQPSLSIPPSIPSFISHSGESAERARCLLTLSPSTLVVRYTDYFRMIWCVDRMTEWGIKPICYALAEQGGDCHINLPLTIYKPPDNVSMSFVNHTGPMVEGHQYTLQCTVQDVAPVKNLTVTFYRGQTPLGCLQSNNNTKKTPVTEIFTLDITPSKEEDRDQYWCEAKLELGPEGPQISLSSVFIMLLIFINFLRLTCEVRGNPQPSVIWFRDGKLVTPPTHTSRKHAGKYTILAKGLKKKNFTHLIQHVPGLHPSFWPKWFDFII
uniref:Ig-like domain-containing protein n=1 Tax=Monopterus albus TaxID=43700 RepID=A0A3Q3PZH2_MONAL